MGVKFISRYDMIWYEYHKIWRGGIHNSKQVYFVCSVQIFMFMVFVTLLGFKFTQICLLLPHFLFVEIVKFLFCCIFYSPLLKIVEL